MKSNYEILGVSRTASRDDIKRAYRKLSMLYHPDRPTGNNAKFIQIKQAYEELSAPQTASKSTNGSANNRNVAYVHILSQEYNHTKGHIYFDLDFRNIVRAYTSKHNGQSLTFFGLNMLFDGITIPKKFLLACNFKFDLVFVDYNGQRIVRSFNFADPRTKFAKFLDTIHVSKGVFFISLVIIFYITIFLL